MQLVHCAPEEPEDPNFPAGHDDGAYLLTQLFEEPPAGDGEPDGAEEAVGVGAPEVPEVLATHIRSP